MLFRNLQHKFGLQSDEIIYHNYLKEIEVSRRVLQEQNILDYPCYLSFIKNLSVKEKNVETIQTCCSQFKHSFVSKHSFKNSEMVEIKFDKSTSLEALTSFAITKDPEGKEIITVIDDGSLKCNKKILINTKTLSSELSKHSSYF